MLNLIKFLLFGHIHVWGPPEREGHLVDDRGAKTGYYRECRCLKCGAWTSWNT